MSRATAATIGFLAVLILVGAAFAASGPDVVSTSNDSPQRAAGPVGSPGALITDNKVSDPSHAYWLYFKIKPNSQIVLHVTDVNGRCGANGVVDPLVVANGNNGLEYLSGGGIEPPRSAGGTTSKGDSTKNSLEILTVHSYARGDGCELRIAVTPASALVTQKTPSDAVTLARIAREHDY